MQSELICTVYPPAEITWLRQRFFWSPEDYQFNTVDLHGEPLTVTYPTVVQLAAP